MAQVLSSGLAGIHLVSLRLTVVEISMQTVGCSFQITKFQFQGYRGAMLQVWSLQSERSSQTGVGRIIMDKYSFFFFFKLIFSPT